jgi:hypothetical protein
MQTPTQKIRGMMFWELTRDLPRWGLVEAIPLFFGLEHSLSQCIFPFHLLSEASDLKQKAEPKIQGDFSCLRAFGRQGSGISPYS